MSESKYKPIPRKSAQERIAQLERELAEARNECGELRRLCGEAAEAFESIVGTMAYTGHGDWAVKWRDRLRDAKEGD